MIKYIILTLSKFPLIPVLGIGIISIIVGDYFAKLYSQNQNNWFFLAMILGYILCGIFFTASLFKTELIVATIILEAWYLIWILLIWFFVFWEKFTTIQSIGMIISIIWVSILMIAE